jgi:DNA replication protein DnaC
MQKRALLNQTERRGQQIENFKEPLESVMERCREKSIEGGRIYAVAEEKIYGEKPPDESWTGKYNGISRLYKDCCFDSFKGSDKMISYLKEVSKTDKSIVLRGQTGCGKTHLAISIAKEQRFFIFISVPDLLLKIRSSFNGGHESEDEIISEYSSVETLVLDDMGAEKTSDFAITTLYIILDRRIRECLKTIITTNLLQSEIEATFGARIASRMSAMENIKINMPDYRKKRG